MNKARIETLVRGAAFAMMVPPSSDEISAICSALETAVRETREEDERLCEEPEPECCGRPDRHPETGAIVGCCGSPEPRPKTCTECAAAIRKQGEE